MDYTQLRSWEQINEYSFLYFLFYRALNLHEEHTVAVVGVFKFWSKKLGQYMFTGALVSPLVDNLHCLDLIGLLHIEV